MAIGRDDLYFFREKFTKCSIVFETLCKFNFKEIKIAAEHEMHQPMVCGFCHNIMHMIIIM